MSPTEALEASDLTRETVDLCQGAPEDTTSTRRITRSVGAVFAGLLTIFAVTTATDVVLHATGIYPGWGERMADGLFVLAAAYRVGYGILGGYVTARVAPARAMLHALALGVVGVIISTAGAIAMWDAGPGWYSLAVIAMSLPCTWAGAKIYESRRLLSAVRR